MLQKSFLKGRIHFLAFETCVCWGDAGGGGGETGSGCIQYSINDVINDHRLELDICA